MTKSKFSRITTWSIRLLLGVVVLITLCLLMLSFLGGNSEYHRQGLEQAFSDTLNSDVTIGTLDHFNIFPQMSLEAQNLHGVTRKDKTEFMVDKIIIVFGFFDLLTGRKTIEDFQIDNLRFSKDSDSDMRIDQARLRKNPDPAFIADGQLLGKKLNLTLPLSLNNNHAAFSFADNNKFSGRFGTLEFAGSTVTTSEPNGAVLNGITMTQDGKLVAHGQGVRKNGILRVVLSCDKQPVPADLTSLKKLSFVELNKNCAE